MNKAPATHQFDSEFIRFFHKLEKEWAFSKKQRKHLAKRKKRLRAARRGELPNYREDSHATGPDWRIKIPDWVKDQRNQMTGPADNAELTVKMLNSGSPGVMLDIEDSMANEWSNLMTAHDNVRKALYGELTYTKRGQEHKINTDTDTVTFVRVRGLHLQQAIPFHVSPKIMCSASLFDLAYLTYNLDRKKLKHSLCIYIPKSESAEEGTWWRDAFAAIEELKHWPTGYIKCMALVESHPLAYEMEEFVLQLKENIVGLNLGRWDYMASLIDYNYNRPEWLFPDRNSIPTEIPFFQNLRHRMAEVCHKRGILAIGGMTALYPSRTDVNFNEKALGVLDRDKRNEASCLMDGAWTGHPDQNEVAVGAFPNPNQLNKRPGDEWLKPELRSFPRHGLNITKDGTRDAIRTCIQYRQGVIEGKGARLINGYMEDLATDRIYRVMICQRLDHGVHTDEELTEMFNVELAWLSLLDDNDYSAGANETMELIKNRQFDPR